MSMKNPSKDLSYKLWKKEADYIDNEIRYNERQRFFSQTWDYLRCREQLKGDYYEFGCHKAKTFRMALTECSLRNIEWMDFYAFDSFKGLPELKDEDDDLIWEKGAFKTKISDFRKIIHKHGLFTEKVHLIKGYYADSLTMDLQNEFLRKSKIAVAFIDCDLYSSTIQALDFIEPLLQEGSVIYFDDYFMFKGNPNKGEQKAFLEFKEKSRFDFIEHMQIGWFGKSFIAYK